MKQIVYRGGLVEFRIPDSWTEEYEPDGGGIFYEDSPDSGTLRLNVLTFEGSNDPSSESIFESFTRSRRGELSFISNGNVLQKYVESVSEDGEDLLIYYWKIGSPVPPRHVRIIIFSYTILASQNADLKTQKSLENLNKEIEKAKFASVLGK